MTIEIRPATPADAKALAELMELHHKEQLLYNDLNRLHPRFDARQLLKAFLEAGNDQFFAAWEAGRMTGFIQININLGGQAVNLRPARESFWKKLRPLRVVRKTLQILLNAASARIAPPPVFESEKVGFIANIYVLPEFRKKGVGTRLVDQALVFFKTSRISHVLLQAFSQNQAGVSFWTRQGFSSFRALMRKNI